MKTEYDEIPVRLPSGTKAIVLLPRPFTVEDARYFVKFMAMYVEDNGGAAASIGGGEGL